MRFFERIKDFLVRWDLMPILWPFGPKGQDGWVPLAIMAGSAIAGALAKKKQADAANNANLAGQQSYNDWLQARKSGVDDIIGKLQQTGWNPYGVNELGSSQYGNQYGSTSSRTGGRESSTSRTQGIQQMRRDVDPAQQAMMGLLNQLSQKRLQEETVSEGEIANAIKQKNAAYENVMRGIQDTAGMSGVSPAMAGTLGVQQQRAADIGDYLSQIPELRRKRGFENEQQAQGLINMLLGSTTTSDSTTDALRNFASNTSGTSNMFSSGGGSQQVGPDTGFLMNLLPPSPQAPMQTGQSPGWGLAGDLFGAAGQMAAQWQANKQGGGGGAGPSPLANLFAGGGGGGGGPVTPTYVPFNPGFKTTLTAPLLK